jgi:hypothetical protein
MRHIQAPQDLAQNALFDSATLDACSWWVTDLDESARRRLEESWHGLFRRSLLKLMPAQLLGSRFDPAIGRPTKELHAMAALVFIMEFKDWTVQDAVDAYTYDNSIHFALNLPNRNNYLSTRTLESYRALLREDDCAADVFMGVTRALVDALNINIKVQRLDSTHLLSDMATFGRTKLLAVAVKRLLTAIKRHAPQLYSGLSAELRERYEPSVGRLFGDASTSKERRAQAQLQVAQDMHWLIETFADCADINERTSYQGIVRLLSEHCEITGEQISVRTKGMDAQSQSSHTLQNPSDPGAGYSGHKGAGYQAQLSETSAPENPVQLILACVPQSAGDQDSQALELVIEQLRSNNLMPQELAADTAYGSDENYQRAATAGVTLISPVPGRPPNEPTPPKPNPTPTEPKGKNKGGRPRNEQPSASQAREARNAQRREEQESELWRQKYRRRAGSESLNRALDRSTGNKQLRVRGARAVAHSVHGKVMGWNIIQSARAIRKLAIAARKAAKKALAPWIEPMTNKFELLTEHLLASTSGVQAYRGTPGGWLRYGPTLAAA